MIKNLLCKLGRYVNAAVALRAPNLLGLPLLPKIIFRHPPYDRQSYNTFVFWIKSILHLEFAQCIIDVGANHGDFSKAVSTCFPEATVWLFEPAPVLIHDLKNQESRRSGRWRTNPLALGAKAGVLPFYIEDDDDNVSSLVGFSENYLRAHPQKQQPRPINVQVETLDNFSKEHDITHLDLLKIDVEGFEFEVLEGADSILQRTGAIMVEVSLVRSSSEQVNRLGQMLEVLTHKGFYIVGIYPMLGSASGAAWIPVEYNVLARRL